MNAVNAADIGAELEAAAEVRRLQPVDAAQMISRPPEVATTYVELEYDELAGEQQPLWTAEAAVASRAAEISRDQSRAAYKTARRHLRGQRPAVDQTRTAYLNTLERLRPFRRREPGAKKWYLVRWTLLLGGDVAGQAGAALSYGEHPLTAIPQALATGMAALTAGMVGGELRDLRSTARRQREADDLPVELRPWAHLFQAPDRGHPFARLAMGVGVAAGLATAGAIFWLRLIIEGGAAGAVYGLLALAIALASGVNAYFYADEIADLIDTAEADYTRELRRAEQLANHPELQRHSASRSESASVREEYGARGAAAAKHLGALKWRVLGNNPGVAGHGIAAEPLPPIGRRSRGGESS
ncbi:hypothetical protein [Mycobacteroides abscessus]|uniref:hypothetical protein n=1 Tax=Mycobacteroides abscessus TaxID=36809 RepID=UPI001878CC57|nr:hypothetical protein [Mycobacteroides abscessus]MDM2082821.1 hypothetical protein [Mycobacteroides abscessus]MDM2085995.1 hypothetical protein [Mycobacteroides abscessus]